MNGVYSPIASSTHATSQKAKQMTDSKTESAPLLVDILRSFVSLPKWVKFWMLFILGPVNFACLFFLSEPEGVFTASLVFAGVLLSILPVFFERGVSRVGSFGHLVPWTILVLHIVFARPDGISAVFNVYLTILALVNSISLAFDYMDAYKWFRGDRAVVRPVS